MPLASKSFIIFFFFPTLDAFISSSHCDSLVGSSGWASRGDGETSCLSPHLGGKLPVFTIKHEYYINSKSSVKCSRQNEGVFIFSFLGMFITS